MSTVAERRLKLIIQLIKEAIESNELWYGQNFIVTIKNKEITIHIDWYETNTQ